MNKQTNNPFIARTLAISISLVTAGSIMAADDVLTRSTGAPVGNNQDSLTV